MTETEVDKMVVALEAEMDEALRGFDKVDKSADKLETQLENVERQSKETETSINKIGTISKESSGDVDKLNTSLVNESKAADNAETNTSELNTEIKETGTESKESSNKIDDLMEIVKGIGVVAGITALINQIKEIGETAKESATQVENAASRMALALGVSGDDLLEYQDIYSELLNIVYTKDPQDIGTAIGILGTRNTDLEKEGLKELTADYLEFAATVGTSDIASTIRATDNAFKKWGIGVEDQAKYLDYLASVTQDTDVEYMTLINTLAQGDRAFPAWGKSFSEAAYLIGSSNLVGEIDDVVQLVGAVDMLLVQKTDELGTEAEAKEYIASMIYKARALNDEQKATNYLVTELGVSSRLAGVFSANIYSSADATGQLALEARALNEPIKAWNEDLLTTEDRINRANNALSENEIVLGNALNKWDGIVADATTYEKTLYNFWGIPSIDVFGLFKTPSLGFYTPAADQKSKFDTLLGVGEEDYTDQMTSIERAKDLISRANELNIDISNLDLKPGYGTWFEADIAAGKYEQLKNMVETAERGEKPFDELNTSLETTDGLLKNITDSSDPTTAAINDMGGPVDNLNTKVTNLITSLQTLISLQFQAGLSSPNVSSTPRTSTEQEYPLPSSSGGVSIGQLVVNSPAADASTMMNTTRRTLRNYGGMMH